MGKEIEDGMVMVGHSGMKDGIGIGWNGGMIWYGLVRYVLVY